jgi:hypothetical protein
METDYLILAFGLILFFGLQIRARRNGDRKILATIRSLGYTLLMVFILVFALNLFGLR